MRVYLPLCRILFFNNILSQFSTGKRQHSVESTFAPMVSLRLGGQKYYPVAPAEVLILTHKGSTYLGAHNF